MMSEITETETEENGRRLLVLDDDAMTGETIRRIGEFAGWESIHTASPADFFDLVKTWLPNVIALDLLMPEMDGVEVMAQLSDLGCNADLIITSGVEDKVLNAASLSASERGLNTIGVLAKPFSPASLRSLLGKSCERAAKKAETSQDRSQRQATVADLRRAIEARDLTVAYQPKIFCKTGTLAGFEALARWSFNGQAVPPDRFISLAEEGGLIDDLTRLMFDKALPWLADFSRREYDTLGIGLRQAHLSLNISARTLTNEALFRWVVSLCDELDIDRGRLIFELTESSAMGDAVTALDTLTRLRMQGFKLSIDDFGTGFSSMVQLVRLPFSEIKIDKSFVMNSRDSAESRAVTRSIVDLGRSLGLLSTAEGVEDQVTLDYLHSLGCDLAQGYFISRPLRDADVLTWYRQREKEREAFRLESVKASTLFGSEPERQFDRITQIARRLFNVPVSLITFLCGDHAWVKSGLADSGSKLPRNETFCDYTIALDQALIVPDARLDKRFRELEVVTGREGFRFYAGYPVCLPNGAKIGALCLLDRIVRDFSSAETALLKRLAGMVEMELAAGENSGSDLMPAVLNKCALCTRAAATIDLAKTLNEPVAIMLFTMDELGSVNRRFGRKAGDRYLQAAADAINSIANVSDLVGRYRGAEIVVIRMNAAAADVHNVFAEFQRALDGLNVAVPVPVHALMSSAFLDAADPGALELAIEEARASVTAVGTSLEGKRQ